MKKTIITASFGAILTIGTAQAATTLIGGAIQNGDFNDTADTFASGNVPNWTVSTTGGSMLTEAGGTTGFRAVIQSPGGSIYNATTYTAQVGDVFTIAFFDQRVDRAMTAALAWDDGGTITAQAGASVSSDGTIATQTTNYTVQSGDAVVGKEVSLLLTRGGSGNYSRFDDAVLSVVPVPEPSSSALLGLGGLALIMRRRK